VIEEVFCPTEQKTGSACALRGFFPDEGLRSKSGAANRSKSGAANRTNQSHKEMQTQVGRIKWQAHFQVAARPLALPMLTDAEYWIYVSGDPSRGRVRRWDGMTFVPTTMQVVLRFYIVGSTTDYNAGTKLRKEGQ
jgi:hypothetical protein